jgi:pimeloyl-CoA synthetase
MTAKIESLNDRSIPKINGSVNVRDTIKNLFSENVKTSFIKGAETAQDQIVNGIVLGGHIGIKQGYLTYTYFVVDHENDRLHIVIIDAGSGEVLYTAQDKHTRSLGELMVDPFGHGVGPFRVEGYIQT